MDNHMHSFGPDEHVIIGGDLNGHVGLHRTGYENHHGGQGFGVRNEEGDRILDFAEMHELALVITYFKKRATDLITYDSGPRTTQVDYLLVRRPDLRRVANAKVIPSDNVAPQHRLLVMNIKLDTGQRRQAWKTVFEKIKWWLMDKSKVRLEAQLNSI